MSQSWAMGSTRHWRRIRQHVLTLNKIRNGGRCRLGIPDVCAGQADCVHHTLGRAVTGDDLRYLVAACTPCNLHVGDPQKKDPPIRPITEW